MHQPIINITENKMTFYISILCGLQFNAIEFIRPFKQIPFCPVQLLKLVIAKNGRKEEGFKM